VSFIKEETKLRGALLAFFLLNPFTALATRLSMYVLPPAIASFRRPHCRWVRAVAIGSRRQGVGRWRQSAGIKKPALGGHDEEKASLSGYM